MSRARREGAATLFWLVMIALLVGGAWWYWSQQDPDVPQVVTGPPAGSQEVIVNFLQDGDSLQVTPIAAGPVIGVTDPVQVRLLGIDAPEMHGEDGFPQCGAEVAKAELLHMASYGGRLWLLGDTQLQDVYGRYLVYAWTKDGTFVNERLAALGAVRELSIPPNYAYEQQLHNKIAEARTAKRGLWGTCIN
jgi:micrococcal nuclease